MERTITVIPARKLSEVPGYRVAVYCRVSTDSEEQASSLEEQIKHFNMLVEYNPLWKLVGVFTDIGTGRNLKQRPEFRKLMTVCEKKQIDLMLTKSISRFGRNTVDSLKVLQRLKALRVDVFFDLEKIYLSRLDNQFILSTLNAKDEGFVQARKRKTESCKISAWQFVDLWRMWHTIPACDMGSRRKEKSRLAVY